MFTLYISSLDKRTCVKGKQIFLDSKMKVNFFALYGEILCQKMHLANNKKDTVRKLEMEFTWILNRLTIALVANEITKKIGNSKLGPAVSWFH